LPSSPNRAKQSSRLWVSLCVSAVMLLALLTGVYSTMVEPTQTNIVTATRTATRWTESSAYSEKTSVYVWRSMEATTLGTITTRFTVCSYSECRSKQQTVYHFFSSIELEEFYGTAVTTWYNVCIRWGVLMGAKVAHDHYFPSRSCGHVTCTRLSLSTRTLTLTSTGTITIPSRSLVPFPVTVTESHYENVPNPQRFNLQLLAVVLSIAGVGGIALAIILRRPLVSAPVAEGHGDMTKYTKYCRRP